LLDAMVNLSAETGYPAITIARLVQRARVARRTFYEHFDSLEACFLDAYDYTAQQIIVPLTEAFDPSEDAVQRAEAYVGAMLDSLSRRPALARMLIVEVGAGGQAATARRLAMHRRIAAAIVDLNRRTRERGIAVRELTPARALALVGGLVELMQAKIQDTGPETLPELHSELVDVVVTLVTGQPPPDTS
jgi:AcrR family transcriptional regulator